MAFYTSGIKSQLIDPIINVGQNRVEYRLNPDTLYSSDIKLLNFGIFHNGTFLNTLAGAWGAVKNIMLLDNGVTLDQLLDANNYMAFNAYNQSCENARNLHRYTRANWVGQVLDKDQLLGNNAPQPQQVNATAVASPQNFLSLRDALPMLRNMDYLPTKIFRSLRVVVEYETDVKRLVETLNVAVENLPQPLLRVDEIVNPQAVDELTRAFKGVAFNCYERDVVGLPHTAAGVASTTGTANSHSALVKGFDNKYIGRMWAGLYVSADADVNLGGANVATFGGTLAPVRAVDTRWQVVVNGANKLVGSGVQKSNEILGLLVDTYGECVPPVGSTQTGLVAKDSMVRSDNQYSFGRCGWFACPVEEYISQLQIDLNWVNKVNEDSGGAPTLSKYNTPYTLYVWAETRKSLAVRSDGSYEIGYN